MIGFNKPYYTGKETQYILEAVQREKISGNGHFTQLCQRFLEDRYGIAKVLLTTSCTDALEMAALLLNIAPGDEVIMPSYTFVSTANAFVLRGANIIFADSAEMDPNIDVDKIEALITPKTKAIVVVHYAGISCDMEKVMAIASRYSLFVVEDAAQAIDSTYKGKALGSIGHLGCFSFHETKNVISGEGGALLINDRKFIERAEILWEKGTNRSAFFRGMVDKYSWIDVGSSFLPSEITAAFLYAQLEKIDEIQRRRMQIWNAYYHGLLKLHDAGKITLPHVPEYCSHNAHIFYLVCRTGAERDELLNYLNGSGVNAIFHYLALHKSVFYSSRYQGNDLTHCDRYAANLIRLPMYFELNDHQVGQIIQAVLKFFENTGN
ncbi:MAG: dTDP-4-amino-4,6-dideoxygalactose transaminase [Bacteroidetes bacterium]|nr:dTDP-4-amino-4,6-dideoxygalactose transaminase [Bacteroidota bacterium]